MDKANDPLVQEPPQEAPSETDLALPKLACSVPAAEPLRALSPTHDPLIGTIVDRRYQVEEALAQGGMGRVYGARHVVIGKRVALKVLLSPGAEAAQQRFLREARLISRVRHMHVVEVDDFGRLPNGNPYLVMEFLEGRTLAKEIRDGTMAIDRSCHIAIQMAQGLAAIHREGIVHRDLKPDNVFLLERNGQNDLGAAPFGRLTISDGGELVHQG